MEINTQVNAVGLLTPSGFPLNQGLKCWVENLQIGHIFGSPSIFDPHEGPKANLLKLMAIKSSLSVMNSRLTEFTGHTHITTTVRTKEFHPINVDLVHFPTQGRIPAQYLSNGITATSTLLAFFYHPQYADDAFLSNIK